MSLINSTAIPSGDTGYKIEQSLRHNDDNDAKLSFTPATNGTSTDVFTVSFWFKRGKLGHSQYLFDISNTTISFDDNDNLFGNLRGTASGNYFWTTNAKFRDPSAWYHIVAAWDSTQSTDTNRFKLYVNGVIQTFSSISYMPQNREMKNTTVHYIGYEGSGYASDGYFAEVNFIDGQTKAPTDFGETGDYGEWKPIEYEGTYGTNGFYLPFKQDYTVEGFSTITWTGNSVNNRYFGGVGFNPDLIWTKARSIGYSGSIYDSVRGYGSIRNIVPSSTEAENGGNHVYGGIASSLPDGFTTFAGTDGGNPYANHNEDGKTYVAWNWDMGTTTNTKHQMSAVGNVKHSTTQNKIGATSIAFDGTGDRLDIPASSLVESSEGTVECWIYMNALVSGSQIYYHPPIYHKGDVYQSFNINSAGRVTSYVYTGSANSLESSTSLSTGAWNHVAVTWNSSGRKIWINGVERASSSTSLTAMHSGGNNATFHIGEGTSSSVVSLNAYVDELRVSKIARYTASFTPYTSALTADNDTTLLLHSDTDNNSTFFVDSSDGGDVNTDGSITSIVAANPTYGQSIVSYTGNGTSGATVGHGLSSTPEMIIVKNRTASISWGVYHTSLGATKAMYLNTTDAPYTLTTFWNDTAPTNQVFSVGDYTGTNGSTNMIAYCFHSVTGYSKFGTYDGDGTNNGSNAVNVGFNPAFVMIKCINDAESWWIFDNARNPLNGGEDPKRIQANSSAAETTGGSTGSDWVELTSTGFKMTGSGGGTNGGSGQKYIYMAFADKREYAYWLDQSGNNNDWTSNNLTESDVMVDSPTNNFSTMNPLANANGGTLGNHDSDSFTVSEGNLKTRTAGAADCRILNTLMPATGKWYFEFLVTELAETNRAAVSVGEFDSHLISQEDQAGDHYMLALGAAAQDRLWYYGNEKDDYNYVPAVGDVWQFAFDITGTTHKIWIRQNAGNWFGTSSSTFASGSPAQSQNKTSADTVFYVAHNGLSGSASSASTVVFNFGQDSSFAGTKTAQGNQDSGGVGDFYYTPPSGFLALCTKNLPDATVTPSEHFNTVLYTGTNATQSISVGFKPDFIWQKARSSTQWHRIIDSVRGGDKLLYSNSTAAEDTGASLSFISDGFTFTGANGYNANDNSVNYVAWNWKANGSGSSNTDGTINTTSTSANVDAGFSIIEHIGNATANATIGHGLSKAPELVISKKREDNGYIWGVFVKELGNQNHLRLDTTGAAGNEWEGHEATTASVIQLSADTGSSFNQSNKKVITYAWHSVDSYSKVGSYTGNGNADGTFVYTGFRPAWLMVKNTAASGSWWIVDCKRPGFNGTLNSTGNARLRPNTSGAEDDAGRVDTLSNGFKIRTPAYGESNTSNVAYIYLAFAETPFKYSNAR